ncbi:hypothetical protein Dimus_038627 [Dionaea muscipula]
MRCVWIKSLGGWVSCGFGNGMLLVCSSLSGTWQRRLWIKWIHARYLRTHSVWTVQRRDFDPWCWKSLLRVRDSLLPFVSLLADGGVEFLGMQHYSSRLGYDALRLHGVRAPWARLVWCGDIFPRHQFILWLAMKDKWQRRHACVQWGLFLICVVFSAIVR